MCITYQLEHGGDDGDDGDLPGGSPVSVQIKTGESSSDADKNANANTADAAPKKRTHPSTKEAKKARVA